METKKINCAICGSLCGVFFLTNTPICEKCLEHHMTIPHIPHITEDIQYTQEIRIIDTSTASSSSMSFRIINWPENF